MTDLQKSVTALNSAFDKLQALRAQSGALVAQVPDATDERGRKQLHQVVSLLGSNLQALRSDWRSVEEALRTAAQVEPSPIPAVVPPGDTAVQQYDEATATEAVQWCRGAMRRLEGEVSLRLMTPLHEDMWGVAESGLTAPAKRRRAAGDQESIPAHDASATAAELGHVLERVRKATAGAVTIHVCSVSGGIDVSLRDAAELRMVCPRVFCAVVVFASTPRAGGGLQVVRVTVDEAGQAGKVDGWTTTEHQVFRRLGALATRALAYFNKRAPAARIMHPLPNTSPESVALEDLLLWLSGHQNLFRAPCAATGRLLALDPSVKLPLPPIFRPFKLTRVELIHLAQHPSLVRAYHMQAAPADELGWVEDDVAGGAATEPLTATA